MESPNILGFLGSIKKEKAGSIEEQQLRLMRLKRSTFSGERFEGKGLELKCEVDGTTAFSDPALTQAYIGSVADKLPKVLIISAILGIVPVLGLIAGVIYHRLRLVAPFRRYLTFGQSFDSLSGFTGIVRRNYCCAAHGVAEFLVLSFRF